MNGSWLIFLQFPGAKWYKNHICVSLRHSQRIKLWRREMQPLPERDCASISAALGECSRHKKVSFLPVRIAGAARLFALLMDASAATRYAPYFSHFISGWIWMRRRAFCASPETAMIDEIWSEKCVFPNSFQIASARGLYIYTLALSPETPCAAQKAARALSHTENHLSTTAHSSDALSRGVFPRIGPIYSASLEFWTGDSLEDEFTPFRVKMLKISF